MNGFTYNGVHCSEFGLYYIPSKEDLWFSDPEYETYEEEVGWRHGGYYYGSCVKIRKFKLKCFFEEIDVAQRQAIKAWLKRDTVGMLIFDSMPFVAWEVRPFNVPTGNWYNDTSESHSGTLTITFTAYNPFGYLLRKSNIGTENDNANDYCSLIASSDMPAAPTTSSAAFDVYNPGTEDCCMSIEIAGNTTNPIRFFNEANGTFCIFSSLPSNNLRVAIDGDTGYVFTFTAGSTVYDNGFAYHDKGVVRLAQNCGGSNVSYVYEGLNGTLHTFALTGYTVTNELKGGKLITDGKTFTINSVSVANNKVYCTYDGTVTVAETGTCAVQTLNHIVIQEKTTNGWSTPSTLTLSYINIDYKPRVM